MFALKRPGDTKTLQVSTVTATITRMLTAKGGTYHTIEFRGTVTGKSDGWSTLRRYELKWLPLLVIKVQAYCFIFRLR